MKQSVKSDPSRERRFRALIQGEFRPEFNREVAIAVRRALRQARAKQQGVSDETGKTALPVRLAAGDRPTGEGLRPGADSMRTVVDPVRPGEQPDERVRQTVHDALVRAQYKVWQAQEAEAKRRYPAMSLERELQNPDFVRLLTDPKRPMSVCRAYEAVHLDDIQADIAREAAVRTAVRMAALSRRPRESGAAPQAGLPMHYGASDPKSRAEIARRALRGERITL
ncbi:hypothetical protein B5F17_05275 [Butyricicoccus pullicaecorum]|uniref:Uncharacterized protein n=1 Tax=Butyricicoccus pullicaecorum TaxID=501571 RepID=A0A1Y4LD42_9FIRM|nr:hypothetical protein [Butyricicoccus pullicaecorum]OUP53419.1 hypothetical protein B5F17_05275 [Butyricicoccus pullicaecorum]